MTTSDDLKRVSRETADRLRARGVTLDGHESANDLVAIEDAIDRFEEAVISRGGDLMVDEGSPGHPPQPDDPHFALPTRRKDEPVAAFVERVERAADTVRRHRPLE
jgi:hypothetical protein